MAVKSAAVLLKQQKIKSLDKFVILTYCENKFPQLYIV